jgi:hypothetical protein
MNLKYYQETDMTINAGLWIDHRKAVIMILSGKEEETVEIKSNIDKQPGRIEGSRSTAPYEAQMVQADDSRERKFTGQLDKYYAEVIAAIRSAESILILGPGEAKGELKIILIMLISGKPSSLLRPWTR